MTYVDLPYFPLWAGDWLAGEATAMMLPEQEGAFIRLLCHSWRAKDVPCSLPDDDAKLAQMSRLYGRWPELGPLVREQFDLVDGRLRNGKLWEVFVESQQRHERHVTNGRKGGKAKPGLSHAQAIPLALPQAIPKQSESYTETATTTSSSANAREYVPEGDWGALDAVLAKAKSPQGAVAELRAYSQGLRVPLKPTPAQLGRAVSDYAANGDEWAARLFRRYVESAIREESRPMLARSNGKHAPKKARSYEYPDQ